MIPVEMPSLASPPGSVGMIERPGSPIIPNFCNRPHQTTLALKAVDDAFGLRKCSICTFQSLSGRGDAMYPAELVQGNIYPVWNTKENTEVYGDFAFSRRVALFSQILA